MALLLTNDTTTTTTTITGRRTTAATEESEQMTNIVVINNNNNDNTNNVNSGTGGNGAEEQEKAPFVAPIDRYVTPRDAIEIEDDPTEIYAVGTRGKKVTIIEHLDRYSKTLTSVCLRSNLIQKKKC